MDGAVGFPQSGFLVRRMKGGPKRDWNRLCKRHKWVPRLGINLDGRLQDQPHSPHLRYAPQDWHYVYSISLDREVFYTHHMATISFRLPSGTFWDFISLSRPPTLSRCPV